MKRLIICLWALAMTCCLTFVFSKTESLQATAPLTWDFSAENLLSSTYLASDVSEIVYSGSSTSLNVIKTTYIALPEASESIPQYIYEIYPDDQSQAIENWRRQQAEDKAHNTKFAESQKDKIDLNIYGGRSDRNRFTAELNPETKILTITENETPAKLGFSRDASITITLNADWQGKISGGSHLTTSYSTYEY